MTPADQIEAGYAAIVANWRAHSGFRDPTPEEARQMRADAEAVIRAVTPLIEARIIADVMVAAAAPDLWRGIRGEVDGDE